MDRKGMKRWLCVLRVDDALRPPASISNLSLTSARCPKIQASLISSATWLRSMIHFCFFYECIRALSVIPVYQIWSIVQSVVGAATEKQLPRALLLLWTLFPRDYAWFLLMSDTCGNKDFWIISKIICFSSY